MATYYKPQSPIQSGEDFIYPITTADQIMKSDKSRRLEQAGLIVADNSTSLGGVAAEDYALKTDTAPDSAKLGGKAPEYYIQPRNLLDNSDFTNPVNQRGQTSYSGPGYTIDRWENNSAACKLTVEDGYIHMQNNSGSTSTATQFIRQKIENPSALIGKTITIAARVKGNCRLGCEGIGLTYPNYVNYAAWTTITLTVDISAMTDSYIAAILQGANKSEWYCSWAALYEGSYTAETLPPYVPKGKHVEMLNCGVSLTPHNLLDNSDFRNPVNQRGKTSYKGGYGIDRWKQWSNNHTTNVQNGHITVSIIQQYIGLPIDFDAVYTMAARKTDGTILCISGTFSKKINKDGLQLDYDTNTDGSKKPYACINAAGDYLWSALYEGSYTAETLPPYVPKGYAAELAECRRYFRRYTAGNASLILSGLVTSGAKDISVNAPELAPMRTKSVSIAYSGSGVIIRGVSGYATECSGSRIYGDISIAPYQNNSSFCATIDINKKDGTAWGLTNNTPVVVSFAANSTLDYVADL